MPTYEEGKLIPMTLSERAEANRIGLMGINTNEHEWAIFCAQMKRDHGGAYPSNYYEVVVRGKIVQSEASSACELNSSGHI
jgi:hypothetical protein